LGSEFRVKELHGGFIESAQKARAIPLDPPGPVNVKEVYGLAAVTVNTPAPATAVPVITFDGNVTLHQFEELNVGVPELEVTVNAPLAEEM
jgi:hypothetical protein